MLAAKPWLQRIAVDDRVPCEGPNPSRLLLRHLRRRARTCCVNGAMLRRTRNGGPLNPATRNFLHNKLQSPSHSTFHSETSKGRFVFLIPTKHLLRRRTSFLPDCDEKECFGGGPPEAAYTVGQSCLVRHTTTILCQFFMPRVIPTVARPVINPTWKVLLMVCRCQGFIEGSI